MRVPGRDLGDHAPVAGTDIAARTDKGHTMTGREMPKDAVDLAAIQQAHYPAFVVGVAAAPNPGVTVSRRLRHGYAYHDRRLGCANVDSV